MLLTEELIMPKDIAYKALAYEDRDNADELLRVLKECGMQDAYIEYDDITESHILYVNDADFSRAEDIVIDFHEELEDLEEENAAEDTDGNAAGEAGKTSGNEPSGQSPVYSAPEEKYSDNLSSAYTFLIFGILGIVALVLYDLGFIPVFTMAFASKVLFNVVMGALFIAFIVTGILSFRYSRTLKLEIDVNASKSKDIMEYLNSNLSREDIEGSCSDSEIPEEMLYYRRTDAIKKCIEDQFGSQPEDFLNQLCDEYYNKIF